LKANVAARSYLAGTRAKTKSGTWKCSLSDEEQTLETGDVTENGGIKDERQKKVAK